MRDLMLGRTMLGILIVGGAISCGPASQPANPVGQDETEDALIAELLTDFDNVRMKLIALSNEFTQEQYDWRPSDGVRSGAEAFMHIAAINFVFPLFAGHAAPSAMALTAANLPTAAPAYEASLETKTGIVPELSASLDHLRAAIESTSASDLNREVSVMGEPTTVRALWVTHVGHLHEHLGQLIAFGRTNGVVPPWSR